VIINDQDVLNNVKSLIDPPVAQSAPAMIVVLTKRINAYRDKCFATQDYSAAIENMLLAIVELGYQSCWYEGHITDDDRICDKIAGVLGVPEGYDVVCILPVGKALDEIKAPAKKTFEERVSINRFGGK
jgi:nitroreductase